jgi:hypothetical protein
LAFNVANLTRSTDIRLPPRTLIYGVPGIGKTTLAASGPNPVFTPCEEGFGTLDVPAFPQPTIYSEVRDIIGSLHNDPHDFKTAVFDTADAMQLLIYRQVCADHGVQNIEDIPYGKGYKYAFDFWKDYIDGISALRKNRGMWVITLAHSHQTTQEPPDGSSYDRYSIKLRENAAELLVEQHDMVLFANYQVSLTKEKAGFQDRTIAKGGGARIINTMERPAFVAKNRYGLPPQILVPESPTGQAPDWSPLWNTIHQAVGL